MIGILERRINSDVRKYYKDALEILYYLPETLAQVIDNKVLWALIAEGIRGGANLSNSISLTKQNIYVKLIEIILLKDNQEERFLDYLSSRIEAILFSDSPFPFSLSSIPTRIMVTGFVPPDPKKITILEYLYERLSGDNLIKFAYLVNKAWRRTRFVDSNPRVNKEYRYTTGPKFLPYHSEKNFGFFSSNVSAFFVVNPYNEDETILELNLETGEYTNKDLPPIPLPFINEEIINHYLYHPFFPIKIVNIGKDNSDFETAIQLDVIVPAFMIKLNRDKQFWHNVMKTVEYAVDVAAIVLSYGTLSELVAAEVITSLAFVRGIGAVAGLSSGVLNLIMKITNSEDSPLGKTLSEYLFWVEMLSLSGELTAVIRNGLKRSAMNLVETEEDLAKLEKQLDDAVIEENGTTRKLTQGEKDEIINEMKEAAGVQKKTVKEFQNIVKSWGGKPLKTLSKEKIADLLTGFTEQGNKISKLILNGDIKIHILDDADFVNLCRNEYGDTLKEAMNIHAFCDDADMYFRSSRKLDTFLSEIIHEGTHAKEALEIEKLIRRGKTKKEIAEIFGNNWSFEKRAFFYERAWQEATGTKKDFDTIEEMLDNIFTSYDEH